MTQIRSTSNPAYVKRQRDSGRSPHFPALTLLFLPQNSPFSIVFSSSAMDCHGLILRILHQNGVWRFFGAVELHPTAAD